MLGNLAARLPAGVAGGGGRDLTSHRRDARRRIRRRRLDLFKAQLQLRDLALDALAGLAELHPLQPCQLEPERLGFQRLGDEPCFGGEQAPLQLVYVVSSGRSAALRMPLIYTASAQPAMVGCHVRRGARQSMPPSNIDNCAGVSVTGPSLVIGHTKRPFSSRFANRQKPWPSQ